MTESSKTFRLFISSTFRDFQREREVLQTKVFPKIKEYCSQKGYTFQPIDLRWGINEEAQLDQKTLELCLEEVRSCKNYPYPNFLVMLGNRYGWIPLPYAIEKSEFETIHRNIEANNEMITIVYEQYKVYDDPNDLEKFHYRRKEPRTISKLELLDQWYTLDDNQIPSSYILNERNRDSDYAVYENWEAEEDVLRNIFQTAVAELPFPESSRRKYFISATEAEIIEGIVPYVELTEHQKRLIEKKSKKENNDTKSLDSQYVYAFLREVETDRGFSDMYVGDDEAQANELKNRVRDLLPSTNIFEKKTTQIANEKLDEQYLVEFEKNVFKFLKDKVDIQLSNEDSLTEIELEKEAQAYFAEQKRENFIGQEKILQSIYDYLTDDSNQPLIIHGSSGIGKSAVMAEAIKSVSLMDNKQLLYRFIGATPNSSSMREVLVSIFAELGKDVRNDMTEYQLYALDDKSIESFEDFSKRIYHEIMHIEGEVVIFIDAVDQLTHDDNFLWLPSQLPPNIKIIISALQDKKYEKLNRYYNKLQNISTRRLELGSFEYPLQLLEKVLLREHRQLQEHQKEYFLSQYRKVASPFYIIVAAQKMRYWKSYDALPTYDSGKGKVHTLSDSQEGIVSEFISDLSHLYHHERILVRKVFGYLFASKDGLGESELLELLEVDKSFVKEIATSSWHMNHNNQFPIVLWTRLYNQLRPFLSRKNYQGRETLYFFYREFDKVVGQMSYIRDESEKIISLVQTLLEKYQNGKFEHNRWSYIYTRTINEYMLHYNDSLKHKVDSEFIASLTNEEWILKYLLQLSKMVDEFYLYSNTLLSNVYGESLFYTSNILFGKNPRTWQVPYFRTLINLSLSYRRSDRLEQAIKLLESSIPVLRKLFENDRDNWGSNYTRALNNLSLCYSEVGRVSEAIAMGEENLQIIEKIYENDRSDEWTEYFVAAQSNLAEYYKKNNELLRAFKVESMNIDYLEQLYKSEPSRWVEDYTLQLNNLGYTYLEMGKVYTAIKLYEKNLRIREELYLTDPSRWIDEYTTTLINIAYAYKTNGDTEKAIDYEEKSLMILEKAYIDNTDRWASNYIVVLSNLSTSYRKNNQINKAIEVGEKCSKITEVHYLNNQDIWKKEYFLSLYMLIDLYRENFNNSKVIEMSLKAIDPIRQLHADENKKWEFAYIKILNDLIVESVSTKKVNEQILYGEEIIKVLRELIAEDRNNWLEDYTMALNSLISSYTNSKQDDKVLDYGEECRSLLENFYINAPEKWAYEYSIILTNLSVSYYRKGYIDKAKEIGKQNIELSKILYSKDPERWAGDYELSLKLFKMFIDKNNKIEKKSKVISRKVRRNMVCPCGSGKKYKKCCGKN